MYLEVKKRIANHQSTKRPGKVIKMKLSRKPVAQPIDEPSIIHVSSSPSSRASSPAPVGLKQKEKEMKAAVEKPKTKAAKGKKEKPPPMTPVDYARMLQVKSAAAATASSDVDPSTSKSVPKRKASGIKFLDGKHIFYTGGDRTYASETTRGRMDLVRFA
jgi:DNA polymerase lambda